MATQDLNVLEDNVDGPNDRNFDKGLSGSRLSLEYVYPLIQVFENMFSSFLLALIITMKTNVFELCIVYHDNEQTEIKMKIEIEIENILFLHYTF